MIWAPLSSARLANVCRKLWNVRFSCVGPTRGIAGARHRRIELAAEQDRRREEAVAIRAGEDEAVVDRHCPTSSRQPSEQLDDVGDQVDVSSLAVLRRPERAARVAPANAHDRLPEIDVAPAQREQLPLPHACLERDEAQASGRARR